MNYKINDKVYHTRRTAQAVGVAGLVGGAFMAYQQGGGFWRYLGFIVLGGFLGSAVGNVIFPPIVGEQVDPDSEESNFLGFARFPFRMKRPSRKWTKQYLSSLRLSRSYNWGDCPQGPIVMTSPDGKMTAGANGCQSEILQGMGWYQTGRAGIPKAKASSLIEEEEEGHQRFNFSEFFTPGGILDNDQFPTSLN